MAHDIALIPGDGIGPEVIDATLPLLGDAADACKTSIETVRFDWGSGRYLDEGAMMPENALSKIVLCRITRRRGSDTVISIESDALV